MRKKVLLLAMLVTMLGLWRIDVLGAGFRDVPADAWYAGDLKEAVDRGLIKGVGDDSFAPDQNISYAQFITLLVREKFGEQPAPAGEEWYAGYVKKAVESGLVDSSNDVSYWEQEISRGMTALFMCKALGIAPDNKKEELFADCSSTENLDYYPYLAGAYKEYLLDGTGFGTGNHYFKVNTGHSSAVTRAQLATMILRVNKYRNDVKAYKEERSSIRNAALATRKIDYGKTIGLKYQSSSEHFDFYLNDPDAKAIPGLSKNLEGYYGKIIGDFKTNFTEKVRVLIYPDIQAFHTAIGQPSAADWVVGTGGYNELKIVSPLNPGKVHNYNSLMQIVVHEFTHTVTWNITGKVGGLPKWLSEGVAAYEAEQCNTAALTADISANRIPSLHDLETKDYSQINGYDFSFAAIDYMVKEYGMDTVVAFIKNPTNFQGVLGITKEDFEKQWLHYLKQHYTTHTPA